jgi:alpha-glucosidase
MKPLHSIPALLLALLLAPAARTQTALPPAPAFTPPTPAQLAAAAAPTHDDTWWKHAVVYEIYPRSFQDTNADGIGDLNGIASRLDYLQTLGVDAIWIAPMYPSPQVDFGYDISNYTAVDPKYGTLADFDRLLAAARAHHIRILLDMVLNHTSDQHPWFVQSAASRTNPRADWYCWANGIRPNLPGVTSYQRRFVVHSAHGPVVPPNNWTSLFGGSAWQWVPARQQFYYHKFYRQQPDLNWRNPAVEKAMFDAMRFWLDRGVAGFRLDAITTTFEDPQLRNEPVAQPGLNAQGDPILSDIYTNNSPDVHGVVRRMRQMVDSYSPATYPNQRLLVGETYLPNTAALLPWYGTPTAPELQLPMDMLVGFHTEGGVSGPNVHLNLAHFRATLTEMQTELDGHQPLLVFDNHDNPRSWDRFGDNETPENKARIARLIAAILYTSRATALTYYGAEIGMTTHTPTRKQDVRDPIGITGWPKEKGRDGERTPMQWTPNQPAAGFSTIANTWLPIGPDYATVNARTETGDPDTLLTWTHRLIDLRRSYPALHDGGIVMLDNSNPSVLTYLRTAPAGSRPVLISLNFTNQPQDVHLNLAPEGLGDRYTWVDMDANVTLHSLTSFTLPPYASFIAGVQ